MMVSKSPGIAILRRHKGPRRSRVRVGARVFVFFAAAVLLTGILGAMVNDKVEEAWQQKVRWLTDLARKS